MEDHYRSHYQYRIPIYEIPADVLKALNLIPHLKPITSSTCCSTSVPFPIRREMAYQFPPKWPQPSSPAPLDGTHRSSFIVNCVRVCT